MAKRAKSPATVIVDVLSPTYDLFCDRIGTPWAGVPVNGHVEYWRIFSMGFRAWVKRRYFEIRKCAVGTPAVEDALGVLAGLAADKPVRDVHLRLAHHEGKIYFDLGGPDWQFVEISAAGWGFVSNPPIPFRRTRGMKELPKPVEVADREICDLRDHTTLDDTGWMLVMGWLLGAFGPGDYPILVLNGEQGSGKSTLTEILRRMIDPSEAMTRAAPRDEQGLMIGADNNFILAFDNLSSLPDWLSDGFCRLSTGAGWSARRLYSDSDEVIISARRPIIINGITDLVTRPDLLDRALLVTVPPIVERKTKADFWHEFEQAQPVLLGKLLDVLVHALKNFELTKLDSYPRMADFAQWVEAGAPKLGWESGKFLRTYGELIQTANLQVLDFSILGSELQELIHKRGAWSGTTFDLLSALQLQSLGTPQIDYFSRLKPHILSGELKRLVPVLRQVGIGVEFVKQQRINGKVQKLIEISSLNIGAQKVRVP